MDSPTDLPKTQIKRIVKSKLAELYESTDTHKRNAAISKDALTSFAECGRVFISHITAAANDVCRDARRNTVTGDDVLQAMRSLQFDDFCEALELHLEEFRADMKEKNRKKAENRQLREAAKEKEMEAAVKLKTEEVDDQAAESVNQPKQEKT